MHGTGWIRQLDARYPGDSSLEPSTLAGAGADFTIATALARLQQGESGAWMMPTCMVI